MIQLQNGVERLIGFGSFVLDSAQRNYCTTRKELLTVVRFTRYFKHYLLGRRFTLRTDHNSLIWLMVPLAVRHISQDESDTEPHEDATWVGKIYDTRSKEDATGG